jgi:hypothetical protein
MNKSKEIKDMSGTYTPYVVFTDWCKLFALATANACEMWHGDVWKERNEICFKKKIL